MSLSTARSSSTASTLALLGTAALALLLVHVALEAVARVAEAHDAYLWKNQDQLRLLSPAAHVNRGAGRLAIYGASEAREGLLPEELQREVPDLAPYQNSTSMGTLDDALIALDYIERAYGRSAVPREILLAVTPRFVANLRSKTSPVLDGIRKYSPVFDVVDDGHLPRLVAKSPLESVRSRARLLALAPDRYRRGLLAVGLGAARRVAPAVAEYERRYLRPAKYMTGRWAPDAEIWRVVRDPKNLWDQVHKWDAEQDHENVARQLGQLLAFAARYNSRVYVVNLPELSWHADLYDAGHYAAYLSVVRRAIGETPFLDLRDLLAADEFWDDTHPTWSGAIRLSREVGAFIARERGRAADTRARR